MPAPKKPENLFIGIDPGIQGGIVLITSAKEVRYVGQMPKTEMDLWNVMCNMIADRHANSTVQGALEFVQSMPGEGHKGAFTFGAGYGRLKMALTAAGVPYEIVQAKEWQKEFSIPGRKKMEPRKELKERCRARCQQLFPDLQVWSGTLTVQRSICDALLLAEYCRRKFTRQG